MGAGALHVVIPSLNTRELLRGTLDTLLRQDDIRAETVTVVDMASEDGTPEMLADVFAEVSVLHGVPNRGYGAAVNAGAAATRGEWLLAANSDLVFEDRGALARLLLIAGEHPQAGILGPRLTNADGSPQQSAHALPKRFALAAMALAPLRYLGRRRADEALGRLDETAMCEAVSVGWVSGALLLVRRQAFEQVGGFDEGFFMNSEEVDLCARMREAGFDVLFVPEVSVAHLGGGSTPSQAESLAWLAEGHARYTRKHFGAATQAAAVVLAWFAWVLSTPVWFGRAVAGRTTFAQARAEAGAYANAIARATRVR